MSVFRNAIVLKLQASAGVTALATGGIYAKLPPEGLATYPMVVVYSWRPPRGGRTFQGVAYEDSIYLVKAIDQNTSPKRASEISAAVRTALNEAALTITGYNSMGIIWVEDVDYTEVYQGKVYQHEGGLYSLMGSPT